MSIPRISPFRWELPKLSDSLGLSLTLYIDIDDARYQISGTIPEASALEYDSISTIWIPEELDVRDIYTDAIMHEAIIRLKNSTLIPFLSSTSNNDGNRILRHELAEGEASCAPIAANSILSFFSPVCDFENGVRIRSLQEGTEIDSLTYILSSTYQQDFPHFLLGLSQDYYNDVLGALFDVVQVKGNVPGLGGFVVFSTSLEVKATP